MDFAAGLTADILSSVLHLDIRAGELLFEDKTESTAVVEDDLDLTFDRLDDDDAGDFLLTPGFTMASWERFDESSIVTLAIVGFLIRTGFVAVRDVCCLARSLRPAPSSSMRAGIHLCATR